MLIREEKGEKGEDSFSFFRFYERRREVERRGGRPREREVIIERKIEWN